MLPGTRNPTAPVLLPQHLEVENGCIFWTEGRAKASERATEALVEVLICEESSAWQEGAKDTRVVTSLLLKMLNEHVPLSPQDLPDVQWHMISTMRSARHVRGQYTDMAQRDVCEDDTTRIEVMFHNIARLDSFLSTVAGLSTVKSCRVIWCLDDHAMSEHSQNLSQDAIRDAFQRARRHANVLGRGKLQAKEVIDGIKICDGSDILPCAYAGKPEAWSHVFKVESSEDIVVPRAVIEESVHLQPQFVEMRAKAEVRFLLNYDQSL